MDQPLKILLIEDNPGDARLIEEMLKESGLKFRLECVASLSSGIDEARLDGFNVILLDLGLPDSQGLITLTKLNRIGPNAPVIVLTGLADEEIGTQAVKEGAQDYLIKGQIDHTLLSRSIKHAIERAKLEFERGQYFKFFQTSTDLMCIADPNGAFIKTNPACSETLGYTEAELASKPFIEFVYPGDKQSTLDEMARQLQKGFSLNFENRYLCKDGSLRWLSWRATYNKNEGITYATARDITDRKQLEESVNAQKKRFETFFDSSITPLAFLDRNFNFIRVNKAYADAGKREVSEFSGHNHFEFYPSDAKTIFEEVVRTRKAFQTFARPFIYADHPEWGVTYWNWTLVPILDNNGDVEFLAFSLVDVTEQKKAEEARETLLRWKEGVNLLQQSLLVPAALDQKLKSITDSIVRLFDADFCRIWLIRPGDLCEQGCIHAQVQEGSHVCHYRDRCLHLLASSGRYTHTDGKVHCRVPFGCYKIGLIASGEEHKFLTNDVQNDPRVHNHEWARDLGLVSFGGYQLRIPEGQPIGVLALFAKRPISADEDTMLDGLSSTAALVIQQASTEEALKKSEEFNRSILETVGEGFIVIDRDFRIISANRAFTEGTNKSLEYIIGEHCYEISHHCPAPCYEAGQLCAVKQVFETGKPHTVKHTHHDAQGKPIYVETNAYPLSKDEHGKVMTVTEILVDITEKKKLEDQLRQAQKMEAVGTLAGGIAHDFNNILNVIMGYGSMVLDKLRADSPEKGQMNEVLAAAEKAANLTKRLLLFSRKEVAEFKSMDVNEMVINMEKMLSRIIGEDINLVANLMGRNAMVMADAGQIEQVLMNLATNARDAMPKGGSLTISTELREIDAEFINEYEYGVIGTYAVISITDTGTGIEKEKQARIFDPFFTTKEVGKGTGLGLSIAYGIIKQHNGYIRVSSKSGSGTTFKIWLPVIEDTAEKKLEVEAFSSPKGGTETILVAEDDASLRKLTRIILESFGYSVIIAEDGEEAITQFRENREKIHLVILDMIMPKKSGKEADDEMRKTSPGIKTLFMSGYTMDMLKAQELTESGFDFIHKPIRPQDLLKKVREILDR